MKRLVLAALIAAAGSGSASDGRGRTHLLSEGEAALEVFDVERAQHAFDQAASIEHAPDTELGLVRTYMQGGEYRRALAFVAHTAGAHRDDSGGPAFYAWLLYAGGHRDEARRILSEAGERFPHDLMFEEVTRQLATGRPLAEGNLLETPARFAPYGALPRKAAVRGSAWLFDDGKRAIVPLATLNGSTSMWLRNGLGELARASVERRSSQLGLAVARLERPLPIGSRTSFAPRDPFPGSVAFAVEYVDSDSAAPRWPILRAGFIGAPIEEGRRLKLDIEWPRGPRGGPVFDGAGRFLGIAARGARGDDRLVPHSRLALFAGVGTRASAPAAITLSADAIYESAMRDTLQVIVAR